MKLKEVITGKNVVFGDTPDGKVWSLKALHPADPLVEVRGIPDHNAVPTVMQNYQWTFTLQTPSGTQPWLFDAFFFPHPVLVGCVVAVSGAPGSEVTQVYPIINTNIASSSARIAGSELDWRERQVSFATQNVKYRCAYMGVTAHHDASALTNTGMLAAAQYPIEWQKLAMGPEWVPTLDAKGKGPAPSNVAHNKHITSREAYAVADFYKTWEQLQNMPNAYLAEAKFGCYCPYRLSHTCQKWRNARALRAYIDNWNYTAMDPLDHGFTQDIKAYADVEAGWPLGVRPFCSDDQTVDGTNVVWPSYVSEVADEGMIHIAARNLAIGANFTFMIRMGLETQVAPGSPLVPFARLSPPHDPTALAGYFAIARELKDAYPEEYNDLGKILSVIARGAAAALGSINPALGATASALIPVASKVIRGIVGMSDDKPKKEKSKDKGGQPQATVERTRQALEVADVMAAMPRRRLNIQRPPRRSPASGAPAPSASAPPAALPQRQRGTRRRRRGGY